MEYKDAATINYPQIMETTDPERNRATETEQQQQIQHVSERSKIDLVFVSCSQGLRSFHKSSTTSCSCRLTQYMQWVCAPAVQHHRLHSSVQIEINKAQRKETRFQDFPRNLLPRGEALPVHYLPTKQPEQGKNPKAVLQKADEK